MTLHGEEQEKVGHDNEAKNHGNTARCCQRTHQSLKNWRLESWFSVKITFYSPAGPSLLPSTYTVTLGPGDPTPSSVFCWHLHSCTHTYTQTCTPTNIHKYKIILSF